MSRIDDVFRQLKAQGKKALMPFVTAGDPDLATTSAVLQALSDVGVSLCEVGFPYSDPIADGPVIQASYTRALEKKTRLAAIFAAVEALTPRLACPLVSMVSYAIVHRQGGENFLRQAQQAGFAGAIIPDLPLEEAARMAQLCRASDFSLIQLVTPTTPRERALRIAETSSGFVYFVSVTGITGERSGLSQSVLDQVAWLGQQTTLPICLGFGISTPEHARMAAQLADGVIVGSAFVRRIAECAARGDSPEQTCSVIRAFAAELLAAM